MCLKIKRADMSCDAYDIDYTNKKMTVLTLNDSMNDS